MDKAARTDRPIHPLIAERWSPRAFVPETASADQIDALIEAARWAPSAGNGQPWRFVVARREETEAFERLLACLVPGNQAWAGNAGALILGVTRVTRPDGKTHRWAWFDLGLAVENLVLQAAGIELAAHQMAGFDREAARAAYAIPETFEPVVAIAIGRVAKSDTLPDDLAQRERAPRERKPADELVFSGEWV